MAAMVEDDGAAAATAEVVAAAEGTVTASMLAEEAGLQAKAEKELATMAVQAQSEYDQMVERQRYSRLKFLLDKTTLYSNFLAQKLEDQRRQSQEKAQRKEEKARAQQEAAASGANDAPQRVGTRSGATAAAPAAPQRKRASAGASAGASRATRDDTYTLADYVSEADLAKRRKLSGSAATSTQDPGAHQDDKEEEEEEEEEPAEAEQMNAPDAAAAAREAAARQPSLVTGGTMRDYQLAGVEWLVSLFENGLNGILADEMGLGKTLQCIAFLAYLRERGVLGPFLIVAPLSTVANWINEFHRFTPSVPVLLYHGSVEERARLRAKRLVMGRTGVADTFPVVVTSYEIVMNDRKHLQRFRWKYIIVDEGHRIKNLNCRLIQELKSYHSANRLLLTGTPLQNNLAELWSLLNFLLPDIFDDLDSFQRWFDFSAVHTQDGDQQILAAEAQHQIVSKLHHILKPFLMRRLKADVERDLPKKREYLVYTPLTTAQRAYYDAIVNRDIRRFLLTKAAGTDGSMGESDPTPPRVPSPRALEADAEGDLDTLDSVATPRGRRTSSQAPSPAPSPTAGPRRRSMPAQSYKEMTDREFYKLAAAVERGWVPEPDRSLAPATPTQPEEVRRVSAMKLQNILMQLRKACNHPYLFDYPVLADGVELRIDEDLVSASGKLQLLDRLLPALLQRGHKTLIFSQMTHMLDILGDYLALRGIAHYRIDGNVPYADRQEQIQAFNRPDGAVMVFLLSTRAGGLGINLTGADTCIIYDSDWNPQMDLQAQDRVHRIGQTKPVIIYRLCTANTAEALILERAGAKRRLEKLVIHQGKFKQPVGQDTALQLAELQEILRSQDSQKVTSAAEGGVISDAELRQLLDRSNDAFQSHRNGTTFKVLDEHRDDGNDMLASR